MDVEIGAKSMDFDDDGRAKRSGTLLTAIAHIITAVIGSGVLSLAWVVAQMGWIAGPVVLLLFSSVTWYASTLLADCYRNSTTGKRHYSYIKAAKSILGGRKFKYCAVAQYSIFVGATIGYTITASVSLAAVDRAICFHYKGHQAGCRTKDYPYIMVFGAIQVVISQLRNFHKLSWLSIVAAAMSFGYSITGIGLAAAKIASEGIAKTSLTGVQIGVDVTAGQKVWNVLTATGNIAFAYAFSMIFFDIQDTLKPNPPENVVMKKAALIGVAITTTFYMLCGCVGYAAFGNKAPGNLLTGFGFYEPYWLVAIANVLIVIHLVGAYQVFVQPLFDFVETQFSNSWPDKKLITQDYSMKFPLYGEFNYNIFRLVWRTIYVILMTIIAIIFPFYNDIVGLIGALSFWPLIIYFPVEMFIKQKQVQRHSNSWYFLKFVSYGCLIVSVVTVVASFQGIVVGVTKYKPFQSFS